jgi:hypothetical protein
MTNPLAQDLGGVVRLLEKATPGKWAYSKRNDPEWPASIISGMDTGRAYAVAMCPRYRNSDWSGDANAIAAAVNFLRAHSAEIAGALRDAERYRWLRAAHGSMDFGFWQVRDFAGCIIGQQPEELDTAIDSAMQQGGGGGDHG